jgi:hypothetical protein
MFINHIVILHDQTVLQRVSLDEGILRARNLIIDLVEHTPGDYRDIPFAPAYSASISTPRESRYAIDVSRDLPRMIFPSREIGSKGLSPSTRYATAVLAAGQRS